MGRNHEIFAGIPALGAATLLAASLLRRTDHGRKLARDFDAPLPPIPGGKHLTPEDHPDIIDGEIIALMQTVHGSPAPVG